MLDFNIKTFKANVRELMTKSGTKQKHLQDLLGIPQPNISDCLNLESSRCFTLEQTIKLADYFGITVEELTGTAPKVENRTALGLASLIVSLLENHDVYHFEHEVNEEIYEPQGYDCFIRNANIKYHAFYFPSYFSPQVFPGVHDEWYEEMELDAKTIGNRIKTNEQVNIFLDRFIDHFNKHEGGFLDDETYSIVKNAFLDAIKDTKPKNSNKKTGAEPTED